MPNTEILTRNAALYGEEISLVEINPQIKEVKASWKDYELVETNPENRYRREMTWREFDDKANRLANFLLQRGLEKGHKVGILLMNCLEWLPIYFGVLTTGALAVPLNFRYTGDEIKLALYLDWPIYSIAFSTCLFSILICCITVFKFIPQEYRIRFIWSRRIGCGIGYFVWMVWLGPILLP